MTEVQTQSSVDEVRALIALALGYHQAALDLARRSYEHNIAPDATALQTAIRAAGWLQDAPAASAALHVLEGQPGRVVAAVRREGEATLAAMEGRRAEAVAGFVDAIRRWRELGLDFEAAVCALSLVTVLGPGEPEARAAGEQAGTAFERLGARPFQKLLADAMGAAAPAPATRGEAPLAEEARPRASPLGGIGEGW
jgi:hypothetical protein